MIMIRKIRFLWRCRKLTALQRDDVVHGLWLYSRQLRVHDVELAGQVEANALFMARGNK